MKQYKVLSLDIWDTVIRRKCHPDEIKLATARYLYLTEYQNLKPDCRDIQKLLLSRIGAEHFIAGQHTPEEDDEYSLRDVFMRSLEEVLLDKEHITEIVERLYHAELNKEIEVAYLDPTIVETIQKFSYEKLGYISDFYAGTDFIDEILEKVGFPFDINFRFVSCEQHLNKRSGRLFEKAMSELQITAAEQVHIGDNPYSDYELPKKLGIEAIAYSPVQEHQGRRRRESLYSVQNGTDLNSICRELYHGEGSAVELAPFFMNYVLWILENCARKNIKKVYYFTREGEFFIQIHNAIANAGVLPEEIMPKAEVLEVSRVATFAPSLRTPTLSELMRLWNQYSIQSMRAFTKSVALDTATFQPWLEKYEITLDEVITYPWLDVRVQKMFENQEFVAYFQNHIDETRKMLLSYCEGRGLHTTTEGNVAIVDIGWRGTIQDNLCYLFPNTKFVGFYLALEQFLNPQPENAEKYGFINNEPNYQYLLRIVSPIEMLCNSPFGSTVGYEMRDGVCVAQRKNELAEDCIFEHFTGPEQKKILDHIMSSCTVIRLHSLMSDQIKDAVYSRFANVLLNPQTCRELPMNFFQLQHNEEFGVGCYVDKRFKFRLGLMFTALVSKQKRKELKEFLVNTSWPQGYLARYRLDPLIPILNKKLGIV